MAGAPFKRGLDYFSHDTNMSSDPKIEFLEIEVGIVGYAIFLKLLEIIYKDEGYFLEVGERRIKLLSKKYNITFNELNNIINVCINEGLFNQELYERYKILTSQTIQKRYLRGCDRRKSIELIEDFLLIDDNSINANTNSNNVYIIPLNADEKQIIALESKVKESKVKESKNDGENKKLTIDRRSKTVTDYLSDKPDDFILAFDEFWEMRKRIKKPIETERTLNKIIKDLEEYSNNREEIMIQLLNQSTDRRWQGIFPLKDGNNNPQNKQKSGFERNLEELGINPKDVRMEI